MKMMWKSKEMKGMTKNDRRANSRGRGTWQPSSRYTSPWLRGSYGGREISGGFHTPYKPCHVGASLLCTDPDMYIARSSDVKKWQEAHPSGMILDVGHVMDLEISSNFEFYLPGYRRVVQVHWSDMESVKHTLETWELIADELRKEGGLICCMGGHGRSGSAAAIMLSLLGKCKGEEAIKTVRTLHCKKAVETHRQIEYLDGLLGKQTERGVETPFFMRGGGFDIRETLGQPARELDTHLKEREEWLNEFDHPWGI